MSWRSRKTGPRKGQHFRSRNPGSGTIFGAPEDKAIAREVHAASVSDAERSAKSLREDFAGAKERSKKEHLYRATLDEANRLEIGAHNMNNGPEARHSMREREEVFRSAANHMHSELWTPDGKPRK
jgi:hypothetical protein